MKSDDQKASLTRRSFLRGASLLGLGGAVDAVATPFERGAGLRPTPAPEAQPAQNFDRFRKTDPALIHYTQTGTLRAPHEDPKRITFGPDGSLWVTAGKNITALDKKGGVSTDLSAGEEVWCLAVSPDGVLHVGLKDHIELYDQQGRRLAKWNSPARKTWLTSLAVGENDVFASDAGNRTVYRFDRSGKLLGRIGEKDKAREIPAYVVPSPYFDLGIGSDGLLWVVNPGFHQFQAFTFDGQLEKKWGQPSFAIEGFCGCCNPSYFTRLADGRFVTSEKGLPRVKVYSAGGKFESVVAGAEEFPKYFENINTAPAPMDVAADAEGAVHVADTLGRVIRVYRRKPQA